MERRSPAERCALAWGDGKDYVKAEKNPIVTGDMLPEKCSRVDFRDPKVWEDNGTYHMP